MLNYMIQLFGGQPRASQWPKVRNAFMKGKACSGCGLLESLECHHIIPFHVDRSLELAVDNLIALCRICHFEIGHLRDWDSSNPHVIEDAAVYLSRITLYRQRPIARDINEWPY